MTSTQDWVLSVCQWAFLIALIPSILGRNKPEFWTSFSTATLCTIVAVTYATLELWVSAVSAGLVALGWSVLTVQATFPPTERRAHGR